MLHLPRSLAESGNHECTQHLSWWLAQAHIEEGAARLAVEAIRARAGWCAPPDRRQENVTFRVA
jgi:hypothetical protein